MRLRRGEFRACAIAFPRRLNRFNQPNGQPKLGGVSYAQNVASQVRQRPAGRRHRRFRALAGGIMAGHASAEDKLVILGSVPG
jgi:hypothetical protein